VPYKDLIDERPGRSSEEMLEGVLTARAAQAERFRREAVRTNADMGPRQLQENCALDEEGRRILERAVNRFGLSARAYARILKVARTVADIAASPRVQADHLAEAIQYRAMDRLPFR
jgi:magnesium chelatase family protein